MKILHKSQKEVRQFKYLNKKYINNKYIKCKDEKKQEDENWK